MHCNLAEVVAKVFWVVHGMLILVAMNSCNEGDPCEKSACIHGTCHDGTCICYPFYEGIDCGTPERDKFLGTNWYNNRICGAVGQLYASKFDASPSSIEDVRIINVHTPPDTVYGKVHGDTIVVPLQVHGFEYIQGAGFYEDGGITLEYKVMTTTSQETSCIAIFSR
jgi:hypothetical protein